MTLTAEKIYFTLKELRLITDALGTVIDEYGSTRFDDLVEKIDSFLIKTTGERSDIYYMLNGVFYDTNTRAD